MRYAKRPWGFWIVLLNREHFKIKLLRFKTGGAISMQRHKFRHELWLFLSGSGELFANPNVGAGDFYLARKFMWHQYKAIKPTWVLEVQYGTKCDEPDIERNPNV